MALQLPHRTLLRRAATAAALGALVAPAAGAAPAAAKAKRSKLPTVSQVRPMQLAVGDTLEIRGRNFLRGRAKNTVVFQRDGAKAVFVKAGISTRRMMKVQIPDRLEKLLVVRDGTAAPTKFRIRILAARFGKRYTMPAGSPTIVPRGVPTAAPGEAAPVIGTIIAPDGKPAVVVPAAGEGDCDGDGVKNGVETDDDGDLLTDAVEHPLGLDACDPDSDDDTVTDGYEYQAALDLNDDEYQDPNVFLPYPGKRPYPNPLDSDDSATDYDGDGLALGVEFALWKKYDETRDLDGLLYSDGEQCSLLERDATGRRRCTLTASEYAQPGTGTRRRQGEFLAWAQSTGYLNTSYDSIEYYDIRDANHDQELADEPEGNYVFSERYYYDLDGNGVLTDEERDEDGDGLNNYDETIGRMDGSWWKGRYPAEVPYYIEYAPTDVLNPDTDGDGVRDGADDQDHDDLPNLVELSRNAASGRWFDDPANPPDPPNPLPRQGFVNPFNPCLPFASRTCNVHAPFEGGWAPFGKDTKIYYVFN